MLFSQVLDLHRTSGDEPGHPEILGDAYLLRENPVYRRIKRRALGIGAVYRSATADYLLLPFNQLDRILQSKEIPYVPNARLMAEVEAKHPGVFGLDDMPMPESYHLHESAHVVAEHACEDVDAQTTPERIMKTILCESFANTVDASACGHARTPEHRLLLKLNCYMAPVDATIALIGRVRAALGEAVVVRLLLLSYVHANFLIDEVPNEMLAAAVGDAKLTKKLVKDCRALGQVGQRLDPLFRVQTTSNFLRMAGFDGEIYDLLAFDFAALLARADFARARDRMVEVLCE